MKSTFLLLGSATQAKNDKLEGSLSTVSIASLVHKAPRYALQQQDDEDNEIGYSNQNTVDVSDYVNSAPASLVQLSKNANLDGTLSVVEIRKPTPEKMVKMNPNEDDDEETGYANQATVDVEGYTSSAPAQLIQLNKDSNEGKTSVVQIKQMKYKKQSHLGEQGDEIEENSFGYSDKQAVDEDAYSKDAPVLL